MVSTSILFDPDVDERALDAEVDKIDDRLQDAGTIEPDVEVPDGVGTGIGGGGAGDGVGDDLLGSLGAAGVARGGASAAGGGGALASVAPVSGTAIGAAAVPVALAGGGLLALREVVAGLSKASPALSQTLSQFGTAIKQFRAPFGRAIAEELQPSAETLLEAGVEFRQQANEQGFDAAFSDLATDFLAPRLEELAPRGSLESGFQEELTLEDAQADLRAGGEAGSVIGGIFGGQIGAQIGGALGGIFAATIDAQTKTLLSPLAAAAKGVQKIAGFFKGGGGGDGGGPFSNIGPIFQPIQDKLTAFKRGLQNFRITIPENLFSLPSLGSLQIPTDLFSLPSLGSLSIPTDLFSLPSLGSLQIPSGLFSLPDSIKVPKFRFDLPDSIPVERFRFDLPTIDVPRFKFDIPTIDIPEFKFNIPDINIPGFGDENGGTDGFEFTNPKIDFTLPEDVTTQGGASRAVEDFRERPGVGIDDTLRAIRDLPKRFKPSDDIRKPGGGLFSAVDFGGFGGITGISTSIIQQALGVSPEDVLTQPREDDFFSTSGSSPARTIQTDPDNTDLRSDVQDLKREVRRLREVMGDMTVEADGETLARVAAENQQQTTVARDPLQ